MTATVEMTRLHPSAAAAAKANARSAERAKKERDYQFSEARWLMSFGTHPDRIAQQLGTSRKSLYDKAHKWHARDIADYVAPDQQAKAKGRCGSCGAVTSSREYTSCRSCATAARFGRDA